MDWRLIREEMLDGATAMALDEVAAETVAAGGPATVRLYRWFPSTLSLGYGTDSGAVDREFCEEWAVDVTRRPTGGGAIYHGSAEDVAYSIVAPAEPFPGDVTESYRQLLQPVLSAFEAFGVDVDFADERREALWSPACYLRELDPAHDLVGPDGRKIAGNAQYRTRDAIVQHGSLSFDVDAETHLGCFAEPSIAPDEFERRVCGAVEFVDHDDVVETGAGALGGYDLQRSRLVTELEDALASWAGAEDGEWTDAEIDRAGELVDAKYGADAWVRERTDPSD